MVNVWTYAEISLLTRLDSLARSFIFILFVFRRHPSTSVRISRELRATHSPFDSTESTMKKSYNLQAFAEWGSFTFRLSPHLIAVLKLRYH